MGAERMPPTRVFRGEGDLMVDALIAASQEKAYNTAPMPGYGRDLVPYFDANGDENADAGVNNYYADAGNINAGRQQHTYERQTPNLQHQVSTPAQQAPPAPKPKQSKKTKPPKVVPAPKGSASAPNLLNQQKTTGHQTQQQNGNQKAPRRWAGPAFSNSPAPDALPVPDFLMGGGGKTSSAAQRSSPPANAGAELMAMLGQSAPAPAAPPPPPHPPHHAASAPDLMSMLSNARPSNAASHAPPPPPAKSNLLTPEALAAMVNGGGGGASRSASASAQAARNKQLLSMASAGPSVTSRPPPPPPAAPAPYGARAPPASDDFQRLLQRLG
jgi:hypothetical protein